MKQNKTLEEIKKEFFSRKNELFHEDHCSFWLNTGECDCNLINIWSWIESTISQTKQELIEEIKKKYEKVKKEPIGHNSNYERHQGFLSGLLVAKELLENHK